VTAGRTPPVALATVPAPPNTGLMIASKAGFGSSSVLNWARDMPSGSIIAQM
jgi:hypothetical protein